MCTRVLWNTNNLAVISGRTMDWPESTKPKLIVFPRGQRRKGGMVGSQTIVPENPLDWTSKYGSVIVSIYDIGTVDGMNEKGLVAHALYLKSTQLPERDVSKPGLQIGLWAQYILDNAATVAEALALAESYQLVMAEASGYKATLHLAIEDTEGDSAIIEYEQGKQVVHHGKQYTLMTNDPSYEAQLTLLSQQDYSKPSKDMPLPGNVNAVDRFQRAAYYTALLPTPKDEREAVADILAIMRNVSVPFGAPYGDFGVYNTEYRTVADLKQRIYFFELTNSPNVIWTELDKLDFNEGAEVKMLDPETTNLSGNISGGYEAATVAF